MWKTKRVVMAIQLRRKDLELRERELELKERSVKVKEGELVVLRARLQLMEKKVNEIEEQNKHIILLFCAKLQLSSSLDRNFLFIFRRMVLF